jgi:hypothetical protein
MMTWREQLTNHGFVLLRDVFKADEMQNAIVEWNELLRMHAGNEAILAKEGEPAYGARNLLQIWPGVMALARRHALAGPLREVLGCHAGIVRVLFFDKPPGHSWALPWHKDYNISVVEHGVEGTFTKPTMKAGVPHVMAPFSLLNSMLTARIHLDDMTAHNGPLRVIPGSHRHYHTGNDENRELVTIQCRSGDVLLMRPLPTHASGHSQPNLESHRRIIHLEGASSPSLPDEYRWHDYELL